MANEEHLARLKQGVEAWNKWREGNPEIQPDLSRINLDDSEFRGINLSNTDLDFIGLRRAELQYANLSRASLYSAALEEAELHGAKLNHADLRASCLNSADLSAADLTSAILSSTDFSYATLSQANFTKCWVGYTNFGALDLSEVQGLENIDHYGPSTIGIDTLYESAGNIPEAFLRGCGLSDWQIEDAKLYDPDLSNEEINDIHYRIHDLRVSRAFQINPLFISYSHNDSPFVDAIDKRLTKQGIRFWRDKHHATAGRLEKQIDRAIYLNDVVLLVLSGHSTNSDWVEHEARKAREKEKSTGKDALCPVALDDSWKTCRWPERLREQIMEYNILDFSNWQDEDHFQKMFGKLLEGLNLFYK